MGGVFGLTGDDGGGDGAEAADGVDEAHGCSSAAHIGVGADGFDIVDAFA